MDIKKQTDLVMQASYLHGLVTGMRHSVDTVKRQITDLEHHVHKLQENLLGAENNVEKIRTALSDDLEERNNDA